jgi:hypothetical protein
VFAMAESFFLDGGSRLDHVEQKSLTEVSEQRPVAPLNATKILPKCEWPGKIYDWVIELNFGEDGKLMDERRITENLFRPASGSRTRPHAFAHGVSRPSAVRRTSPKCP